MEAEIKTSLPAKLVSLRKQKGLTQMELAEKLNVSRQAISRWEVGAAVPSTDNLKVLGDLYGVSFDYLLNDDAEDSSKITQNQEPVPGEQSKKSEGKKHMIILLSAVVTVVVMAVAVIIFTMTFRGQKQEEITPIKDMAIAEETDYTTYTFSIE